MAWVWGNEQGSSSITKRKFSIVNNNWPRQHFRLWAQSPRIQCKAGRQLNFKWLTGWSLLFLFLHLHCSSHHAMKPFVFSSQLAAWRTHSSEQKSQVPCLRPENAAGTQGPAAAAEPALLTFPISTALAACLSPSHQPGN